MQIKEYKKRIEDTWLSTDNDKEHIICGLFSELGEIASLFAKSYRGDYYLSDKIKLLKKEIGDLMYFVCKLCNYYGLDLEEILDENIAKLKDRKERGVLRGSGDLR
jgi:NTP pyrophosphatase (non-canonical NTP hydrolase)